MATQPPVIQVYPQIIDQSAMSRALVSGYEAGTRTSAINADVWRQQMQSRLNEERATLQLAAQMQQLELKEAAMEMANRQKEQDMALRAQQFQDKLAFEAEKAQLGALQKGLDRASREEIAGMNIEGRKDVAEMNIAGRQTRDERYRAWMDMRPGERIKDIELMAMESFRQEMSAAAGDNQKMAEIQAKWVPLFGGRGMTPDALLKIAELTDMYKSYESNPELANRFGNNLSAYRQGKEAAAKSVSDFNIAKAQQDAINKLEGASWLDRQKAYDDAQKAYSTMVEMKRIFGGTNNLPTAPVPPGGRPRLDPGLLPPPSLGATQSNNPRLPPTRIAMPDLNATFGPNQPNAVTTLYLGNTNATVDRNKFLDDWSEVRP